MAEAEKPLLPLGQPLHEIVHSDVRGRAAQNLQGHSSSSAWGSFLNESPKFALEQVESPKVKESRVERVQLVTLRGKRPAVRTGADGLKDMLLHTDTTSGF